MKVKTRLRPATIRRVAGARWSEMLGTEYERVGVAANVSSDVNPWTTERGWFDSPHTTKIILV
jgi:hypothetical protein